MPKYKLSNNLYPFFCYYGGKWRTAKWYANPLYPNIIEPFAGAAGYSLRYPDHQVTLYDTDPAIFGIWDYLIKITPHEIRQLPINVTNVHDLSIPQEAKWLIGFWLNKGTSSPQAKPSAWMRGGTRPNSYWGEIIRERIANQVDRIKHWKVINQSYETANNIPATWFIDPPYQGPCGKHYVCKFEHYDLLSKWCQQRQGQTIVCEQAGATWLPFQHFRTIRTNPSKRGKSKSHEVMWTNLNICPLCIPVTLDHPQTIPHESVNEQTSVLPAAQLDSIQEWLPTT